VLSMVSMSSTLIGCVQAVSELNYSKLEEVQIAEGNYSKWLDYSDMADISNASTDATPKISIGNYESTKYEIPIGPYKASFELRSPLSYFGVRYYPYNESVGFGKEYHTARYDVYSFLSGNVSSYTVVDHTDVFNRTTGQIDTIKNSPDLMGSKETFGFYINIIHYKGPSEYQPTEPSDLLDSIFRIPSTWDDGTHFDITIDGKKGTTWNDVKWSKTDKVLAEKYTYRYDLDQDTFVVITTSGKLDLSKDLSLFEETLHIAKK